MTYDQNVGHYPVGSFDGPGGDMNKAWNDEQLEPLIFAIRGQRVVLDADLARLYGVSTKRFNEAFKRNHNRFPDDFAFQLTITEFNNLRSQIVTSRSQASDSTESKLNRSQFATGSKLLPLLQPPPALPKRRIGFHTDEK